jgi:hypothetical protein
MTDLTKIEKPFGLLDTETQAALRAHGGPYEWFMSGKWEEIEPMFAAHVTYRVKPQPPKPREFWISVDVAQNTPNPVYWAVPAERPAPSAWESAYTIRVREALPE